MRCMRRRRATHGRRRSRSRRTIRRGSAGGKNAEFVINVQRVEEQVLPPLDDAFAASFGVNTGNVEDLTNRGAQEHGAGARASA